MAWRPASTGEVVPREVSVATPLPEQLDDWRMAARMAHDFWQQIMDGAAISDQFRAIAKTQLEKLNAARARFD